MASARRCSSSSSASGLAEQIVELPAADSQDVADFECPAGLLRVRLVRHVNADASVRMLMTSLMDTERFPAALFGELYHQRWSIEEVFKRLKHRLNLEQVSGLSHLAVQQDFAAKVLCDNLAALASSNARSAAQLSAHRRINRAYARSALLLGLASAAMLKVDRLADLQAKARLRTSSSLPNPYLRCTRALGVSGCHRQPLSGAKPLRGERGSSRRPSARTES